MSRYLFGLIFCIVLLLLSCKKENKPAPISKMYMVEYGFDFPEPPATEWIFYVHGISEIDPMYNVVTTQRGATRSHYRSHIFTLGDSIRQKISDIIDSYPRDTSFVFSGGEDTRMYGGYYFFLWIERQDNSRNLIDLYMPRNLPADMKYVYDRLYGDYKYGKLGYIIKNEDSLTHYLSQFETCLPEGHISRPPAIKWDTGFTFIPPTDDGEDDEIEYDE